MVLVDTSVLIDFLNGRENAATVKFDELLELNVPYAITGHIYQETLQGTATSDDFNRVKKHLDTVPLLTPAHPRESYAAAAGIYFKCRKKGITVAGTIDCLIAQIALENNARLLHNDRDFDRIAKVESGLLFY
jgi:predicted nucleic acid-binding protein